MAKKRRKSNKVDEAEVPLSSMIDVVFLLLIYFIVTQKPIIEDTLLGVNLPAPGGSKSSKPVQLFTIDVMKLPGTNSDDIYHLNGRPWYFKDLKVTLLETAKTDPDMTVIINCGPNAKHLKLIKLLDACAEAKLTKLNIVNDESIRYVPARVK
jgi:biopolymer transport protein ExbD